MNSFIETNNNNNNLNLKSINSESIKLQNNDKENKEKQNNDNGILKDDSDINQQKLNDESNQDLVIIVSHTRALYDFLAENTSELSFQEGDILTINYQQCVGWLVAELDGKDK
ncbi:5803_t:CDS:2 [Entrophospora sp. SA101]|nr:5803_t:CDS:2 [Entrophospora sp. SA101]